MTKAIYSLVGIKHAGASAFFATLSQNEPLELVREPGNQYDPNAVQVRARGVKIGYVGRGRDPSSEKYKPGTDNEPLARQIEEMGQPGAPGDEALRIPGRLVAGLPPQIEVEE